LLQVTSATTRPGTTHGRFAFTRIQETSSSARTDRGALSHCSMGGTWPNHRAWLDSTLIVQAGEVRAKSPRYRRLNRFLFPARASRHWGGRCRTVCSSPCGSERAGATWCSARRIGTGGYPASSRKTCMDNMAATHLFQAWLPAMPQFADEQKYAAPRLPRAQAPQLGRTGDSERDPLPA